MIEEIDLSDLSNKSIIYYLNFEAN
jgi:hypothetical protein